MSTFAGGLFLGAACGNMFSCTMSWAFSLLFALLLDLVGLCWERKGGDEILWAAFLYGVYVYSFETSPGDGLTALGACKCIRPSYLGVQSRDAVAEGSR